MKYLNVIVNLFMIVSVIFLFYQNLELAEQTKELREQNRNMEKAIDEEKNQTKEMKINNLLNNEKLLFDLKEYLVNTRVTRKNNETYIERLKNYIIAKKFRNSGLTQKVELPHLDLRLCNFDYEKEIFTNVDFSKSLLPKNVYQTNFDGSILNLNSKNNSKLYNSVVSSSYIFSECSFKGSYLRSSNYDVTLYRCNLENVDLSKNSNKNEIVAIDCDSVQSMRSQNIKIFRRHELEELVSTQPEKIATKYQEIVSQYQKPTIEFSKLDTIVLRYYQNDTTLIIKSNNVSFIEKVNKYQNIWYEYNLLRKQLNNINSTRFDTH